MLTGKKFLVTAGPTYEPIDPVRFIGNRSSGKMGFCIAESLATQGAEVLLISGPVSLKTKNPLIKRFNIETAEELYHLCIELFPSCNGAIMAAAVSDFTPEKTETRKIKKIREDELVIKLKKTADILEKLGKMKMKGQILVGFSLETDDEINHSIVKLATKNLDFIVLNSLNDKGAGFGTDTNKITIINKEKDIIVFPLKSKKEVAEDIVNYLNGLF
jgi:phosphopantothenoylcysteine decarboxylase / phosphopantothenate---cysteine ligase